VGESAGYAEIADAIEAVPGVVAHGLFVGVATSAGVATPDWPPHRAGPAPCLRTCAGPGKCQGRVARLLRRRTSRASSARCSRRACRRAWGRALALASVR